MIKPARHAVLISLAALVLLAASGCAKQKSYEIEIDRVKGRYLLTNDHRVVAMIGIYVPVPGEKNFFFEYYRGLQEFLLGKKVTVRTVLKKHKVGYPDADLVEVFINDVNINKQLLDMGMAFFHEDHWNPRAKEEYRAVQEKAKAAGVGIWEHIEDLEVLFVRPKKARMMHYADCPFVKDVKPEERINYYHVLRRWPFRGARLAFFCNYCKPRLYKMFGIDKDE
jgi:hypothetical protein